MSVEKFTPKNNPEHRKGSEKKEQHQQKSNLEKLRVNPETNAEKPSVDKEKNIEHARKMLEADQAERMQPTEQPSEKRETEDIQTFSKAQKKAAYKSEMRKIQQQLPPTARVFSKIVHNPAVEVVSDVAAETIMRPSFLIVGATAGIIVGGGLYITAKIYGFTLPNSQFLLAFIVGGVIGVAGELLLRLFRRK